MKTLNKLNINSEKLMKSEELLILKGGYGGACCWCVDQNEIIHGAMAASDPVSCNAYCSAVPGWHGWWDPYDSTCKVY